MPISHQLRFCRFVPSLLLAVPDVSTEEIDIERRP